MFRIKIKVFTQTKCSLENITKKNSQRKKLATDKSIKMVKFLPFLTIFLPVLTIQASAQNKFIAEINSNGFQASVIYDRGLNQITFDFKPCFGCHSEISRYEIYTDPLDYFESRKLPVGNLTKSQGPISKKLVKFDTIAKIDRVTNFAGRKRESQESTKNSDGSTGLSLQTKTATSTTFLSSVTSLNKKSLHTQLDAKICNPYFFTQQSYAGKQYVRLDDLKTEIKFNMAQSAIDLFSSVVLYGQDEQGMEIPVACGIFYPQEVFEKFENFDVFGLVFNNLPQKSSLELMYLSPKLAHPTPDLAEKSVKNPAEKFQFLLLGYKSIPLYKESEELKNFTSSLSKDEMVDFRINQHTLNNRVILQTFDNSECQRGPDYSSAIEKFTNSDYADFEANFENFEQDSIFQNPDFARLAEYQFVNYESSAGSINRDVSKPSKFYQMVKNSLTETSRVKYWLKIDTEKVKSIYFEKTCLDLENLIDLSSSGTKIGFLFGLINFWILFW